LTLPSFSASKKIAPPPFPRGGDRRATLFLLLPTKRGQGLSWPSVHSPRFLLRAGRLSFLATRVVFLGPSPPSEKRGTLLPFPRRGLAQICFHLLSPWAPIKKKNLSPLFSLSQSYQQITEFFLSSPFPPPFRTRK